MVYLGLCSNVFTELLHEINEILLVTKDGEHRGFGSMFVLPRSHDEILIY